MTIRVEDGLLRLLLLIIRLLLLSFLIIVQVIASCLCVELSSDGKAICKYANKYCLILYINMYNALIYYLIV